MRLTQILTIMLAFGAVLFSGCGESIEVVDAGAYTGTIDKVVPEEQEIYVSLDDGKQLELYFTETTELLSGGQPAQFDVLQAGQQVQVTVEREGNRNVPVRVEVTP